MIHTVYDLLQLILYMKNGNHGVPGYKNSFPDLKMSLAPPSGYAIYSIELPKERP